jgi:hypothetical protein
MLGQTTVPWTSSSLAVNARGEPETQRSTAMSAPDATGAAEDGTERLPEAKNKNFTGRKDLHKKYNTARRCGRA